MAAQMSRVTKMVVIVCLLSQLIMLVEGEEEEGGSKHNGDDSSKTPKKAAPGAPTNSADGHKTPHTKQSTTPPYTEQEKEEVDMIKKLKEQGRR
ncbi:hypothetical protein M8J75_008289 [Diaphorina citri]|nr:hypothetical protein M8J75_008289 [Diaphorina citri]